MPENNSLDSEIRQYLFWFLTKSSLYIFELQLFLTSYNEAVEYANEIDETDITWRCFDLLPVNVKNV